MIPMVENAARILPEESNKVLAVRDEAIMRVYHGIGTDVLFTLSFCNGLHHGIIHSHEEEVPCGPQF